MDSPHYVKHYECLKVLPIVMHCCGGPEVEIQHHELGVCGGGVLCSGSLGTFRLMFGCLLSSLQPPSFPFFASPFSLFCLHSFSARDINTSRSNSRSFCFTGSASKESSLDGREMEGVDETGCDSRGRKTGEVRGDAM